MWLVLANDIIDCLNIDSFFENCMKENLKYSDQTYFEKIKSSNFDILKQMLNKKL